MRGRLFVATAVGLACLVVGFLVGGAVATLASARVVYLAAGLGILTVTALLLAPRETRSGARTLLRALPRGAMRVAALATRVG